MRGGRRASALALAVALVAVGVARAQDGDAPARSVAATDRARDVAGRLDVRRVALGRGRDGRLRGEVTMRRAWSTDALRSGSGPAGSVCLRLFTKRDPASEPPDYLVCVTPASKGDELVGRVLRDRANGLPRDVGPATVSRPTERTVFVKFTRTQIGRPTGVRFGAESVSRDSGCPRPVGCRDLGPDAPRTMLLRLRSG